MSVVMKTRIGLKDYNVSVEESLDVGTEIDFARGTLKISPSATGRQIEKALNDCRKHEFPPPISLPVLVPD